MTPTSELQRIAKISHGQKILLDDLSELNSKENFWNDIQLPHKNKSIKAFRRLDFDNHS